MGACPSSRRRAGGLNQTTCPLVSVTLSLGAGAKGTGEALESPAKGLLGLRSSSRLSCPAPCSASLSPLLSCDLSQPRLFFLALSTLPGSSLRLDPLSPR